MFATAAIVGSDPMGYAMALVAALVVGVVFFAVMIAYVRRAEIWTLFSRLRRRIAWMDRYWVLEKMGRVAMYIAIVVFFGGLSAASIAERGGFDQPSLFRLLVPTYSVCAFFLLCSCICLVITSEWARRRTLQKKLSRLRETRYQAKATIDEVRARFIAGYRECAYELSSHEDLRIAAQSWLGEKDPELARYARVALDEFDMTNFNFARARFHDGADVPSDVPLQPEEVEALAEKEAKEAEKRAMRTSRS